MIDKKVQHRIQDTLSQLFNLMGVQTGLWSTQHRPVVLIPRHQVAIVQQHIKKDTKYSVPALQQLVLQAIVTLCSSTYMLSFYSFSTITISVTSPMHWLVVIRDIAQSIVTLVLKIVDSLPFVSYRTIRISTEQCIVKQTINYKLTTYLVW